MKTIILIVSLLLMPLVTSAQTFPSTGVLDSFNRADNDITIGSNWVIWPFFNANLSVISNQVGTPSATSQGNLYAVSHGPDVEYYVTIAVLPADGNNLEFGFRHDSNTAVDTWYGLTITKVAGSNNDTWRLFKFVTGSFTEIQAATSMGIDLVANDVVGLRMVGSAFNVYVNGVSRGNTTDGSITNAGYGGLITADTTIRFDDFGGGTFTAVNNRQRILGTGFRGILQ